MLCTSTEAQLLECPDHPDILCYGNGCMAWRWYDTLIDSLTGRAAPKSRRGYCGLAGKPDQEE